MSYMRVCPRDLFNEANFLKCLGRLTLLIHDGDIRLGGKVNFIHEDERDGFKVDQDQDGNLYCENLKFFHVNGLEIDLHRGLNSRLAYPLWFEFGEYSGYVFDDKGDFDSEFLDAIKER